MIRLKTIIKENIYARIILVLIPILAKAVYEGISWLISTSIDTYNNRNHKGLAHIKWLDRLNKNDSFNKYIYYTIEKDKTLKKFADEKLKTGKIEDISKFEYERKLVDKWLDSRPARQELDNLCKELYPNEKASDIKFWKSQIIKKASAELTKVLNSGKVKDYINKYAKGHNLRQL
jgi:hypothetical protein